MVNNTTSWISWERNITFLQNKKILNLCPRWHILRSYRIVAEVTFKRIWSYKPQLHLKTFVGKWEKVKYNALTLVFRSWSPCSTCALSWLVYYNYINERLHEYISSDVDMNIETKYWEVILKDKMFMYIN